MLLSYYQMNLLAKAGGSIKSGIHPVYPICGHMLLILTSQIGLFSPLDTSHPESGWHSD